MKTQNVAILLFTVLFFSASFALANERQTLISGEVNHGGFGGWEVTGTQMGDNNVLMTGGRGAWLLNHSFYLGGAGYGSAFSVGDTGKHVGYGGLLLGFIGSPNSLVNYGFDVILGAGGIANPNDYADNTNCDHNADTFLVVEPGVNVALNVFKYGKINLGASYRFVSRSDDSVFTNDMLSGASVKASMIFGKF
ncbi:MAG: hypothetical protein OEZ58_00835 [Gammaproteobacteria bacterium]|nr:hypothetical protein [Gammaproteobacteria bacterium]MDH5727520.1 hypothetical protein [Gammaproteobacteria bacterium]